MSPRCFRLGLTVALISGCVVAAPATDVVILKDGFIIQGEVRKETETIFDKTSGQSIRIVKGGGFDMIDEGPKVMVFSTHARQVSVVSPETKLRPDYKSYKTQPLDFQTHPLPGLGETVKITEFDEKWRRTIEVKVPGAANEQIVQQITHLDPHFIYVVSSTHRWRLAHRTSEWDPKLIRKLLSTHPELSEPDGKADPLKRVAIAKFMLDAGWLQQAKDEMDRLKREFQGDMSKEAKDQHDKVTKELERATAELVVREAELALSAGRYQYATDLLAVFPEKLADPKEIARKAKLMADLKTSQERYDACRRLLRLLIDEVNGMKGAKPLMAVGGGLAVAAWKPEKTPPKQSRELVAAASQVYAELHQDSAIRIETFATLAAQYEREKAQGKNPTKTPEELLATAISGWAKGKNGATPNITEALQLWSARETVLAYQRATDPGARTAVLGKYKENVTLKIDELAQIISLLPPVDAEDLENRSGKLIPSGKGVPEGVYKLKTGSAPEHAAGIEYLVKLPPEYHHGRAYPVLIVLTHPGINPVEALAPVVQEADKHGYILIAPVWSDEFGKGNWEYRGEDHVYVTATLRDTVRRFTVDNDRVFMLGVADGANMAMDVGMSHPDLFAGVVAMGPIPRWQNMFINYWKNAQKLPFYVVTGEYSGDSLKALRELYKQWMPQGFPALMSIYKGRAIEWFAGETPAFFDWMGRKTRATPASVLKLDIGTRQPWMTMRETDNRFYWLQADKLAYGNQINNLKPGNAIIPAQIQGDIRGKNLVDIQCRGVTKLTIWLSRDMITDWKTEIRVQINGGVPHGYRAKVMEPNLE